MLTIFGGCHFSNQNNGSTHNLYLNKRIYLTLQDSLEIKKVYGSIISKDSIKVNNNCNLLIVCKSSSEEIVLKIIKNLCASDMHSTWETNFFYDSSGNTKLIIYYNAYGQIIEIKR